MNLTEREKWLMSQAWESSAENTLNGYSLNSWLSELTAMSTCISPSVEEVLAEKAPTTESIVKKVDTNKLPTGEVLGISPDGLDNFKGHLFKTLTGSTYCEVSTVEGSYDVPCSQYIEEEDILKLFEGKGL